MGESEKTAFSSEDLIAIWPAIGKNQQGLFKYCMQN